MRTNSKWSDSPEWLHFHFPQVDSTNSRILELARQHPGQRLRVRADEQSAGRGRTGRQWISPRGGAWFSLLIPLNEASHRYAVAPLLAGLAVVRVLGSALPPELHQALQIKWPNDVLLTGKKVCGILCENASTGVEASDYALVVGVGINVNFPVEEIARHARLPATSLQSATGRSFDLADLTDAFTDEFFDLFVQLEQEGFSETLRSAVQDHLAWRDESVKLKIGKRTLRGTLRGLNADGHLQLESQGAIESFAAGEIEGLAPTP